MAGAGGCVRDANTPRVSRDRSRESIARALGRDDDPFWGWRQPSAAQPKHPGAQVPYIPNQ